MFTQNIAVDKSTNNHLIQKPVRNAGYFSRLILPMAFLYSREVQPEMMFFPLSSFFKQMSSSISESTNLISFYLTYLLTAVVLCRINSALMHHYAHTDTTGTLRKGDRSKKCPAPKVSRAREEDQQVESRGWETQNWPPPTTTIKEGAHHVPTNSALLKARLGWAGMV